jgi:3-isopropylmalate dehydrogenase
MMFEYAFQLNDEANDIRRSVDASLAEGVVTVDIADGGKAYSTSEVGDWLADKILAVD